MRRLFNIIILLFCGTFFIVTAQDDATINNYYDAEYALSEADYEGALTFYSKVLKKMPDNAYVNYKLGICLLNIEGKKRNAKIYFFNASQNIGDKIKEGNIKETRAPNEVLYYLGKAYLIENKLDSAYRTFLKFKEIVNPKNYEQIDLLENAIKTCEIAQENLKKRLNVQTSKIDAISSSDSITERVVMSADGNSLVYMTSSNKKTKIMYSTRTNNIWSVAKDISMEAGFSKGAKLSSISADGKRLYFVVVDEFSSDIYLSELIKNKWKKGIALSKPVNTSLIESHAAESPDANTLYITREETEYSSNFDILILRKKANGEWGKPEETDFVINTNFAESTPFVSSDGTTLYFSSEAHQSMGGLDVFLSKINADGSFSTPVNLGYPINSTDDDQFFFPISENQAFFSIRDINNEKQRSVSNINYSKEIVPRTFVVKGYVRNSNSSSDLNNLKVVFRNSAGDIIDESVPVYSGSFEKLLKSGFYQINISAEGYETFIRYFTLDEKQSTNDLAIDAVLNVYVQTAKQENIASPKVDPTVSQNDNNLAKQVAAHTPSKSIDVSNNKTDNQQETLPVTANISDQTNKRKTEIPKSSQSNATNKTIRKSRSIANYTIQIGAYIKTPEKHNFTKAGEVYSQKDEDGLTRYFIGQYQSKSIAIKELKNIVKMGYSDAFLVKLNRDDDQIREVDNRIAVYIIQIKNSKILIVKDRFLPIKDVVETLERDGYYRYTTGEFKSAKDAYIRLDEIRKLGYKDAFVKYIKK